MTPPTIVRRGCGIRVNYSFEVAARASSSSSTSHIGSTSSPGADCLVDDRGECLCERISMSTIGVSKRQAQQNYAKDGFKKEEGGCRTAHEGLPAYSDPTGGLDQSGFRRVEVSSVPSRLRRADSLSRAQILKLILGPRGFGQYTRPIRGSGAKRLTETIGGVVLR